MSIRSRTMVQPPLSETTQLLLDWVDGDPNALNTLAPRIYNELRRMAAGLTRREKPGRTLQPTALVHEAYLRLVDVRKAGWKGKAHFYAACAEIMRRILVDGARRRSAVRHGGGLQRLPLEDVPHLTHPGDTRLLALDEALNRLQTADVRKAQVVELRYFGGLSVDETAEVLKVSAETVTRDWRLARAWLLAELKRSDLKSG